MTLSRNPAASLAALLGLSVLSPAHAAAGDDVLARLGDLYADTAQDCGSPSRPAFLCSGLMLSATAPSIDTMFYGVSAPDQARSGVSVSYLRKDAKFKALPRGARTGFIYSPGQANAADHQDAHVLCVYPVAGATEGRAGNGCGDAAQTVAVEKPCDQAGITTAAQWLSQYRSSGKVAAAQCAFDTRKGSAHSAAAFNQSLQAIKLLGAESLNSANEMILAPWHIDPPRSPSVTALFHTDASGLNASRLSQIQWYQVSHWLLPIVGLRLPQTLSQEASFTYNANHQAIFPESEPSRCAQYIERAEWIIRYDPGFKRDIPTLSVLPTTCGRAVQTGQTNNFMNEMVAKFYAQPNWINNTDNRNTSIPAMRRQLICHLMIARGKARYNLEPSRPLVDQGATNAAGCNNF